MGERSGHKGPYTAMNKTTLRRVGPDLPLKISGVEPQILKKDISSRKRVGFNLKHLFQQFSSPLIKMSLGMQHQFGGNVDRRYNNEYPR